MSERDLQEREKTAREILWSHRPACAHCTLSTHIGGGRIQISCVHGLALDESIPGPPPVLTTRRLLPLPTRSVTWG